MNKGLIKLIALAAASIAVSLPATMYVASGMPMAFHQDLLALLSAPLVIGMLTLMVYDTKWKPSQFAIWAALTLTSTAVYELMSGWPRESLEYTLAHNVLMLGVWGMVIRFIITRKLEENDA